MRLFLLLFAALLASAPSHAQPAVTSPAPDRVAVTIYRDSNRDADDQIDFDWLGGYALVTETRTVAIPAGRAVIRFEGVAAGILPESAIVTGLPEGVREKNLDADLLSPRSLYARSLGRPVTIRRLVGDRTVEERAIIRSGPDGAAILQTEKGFLAVDCGPDEEYLAYDQLPPGLSARPTLSIETQATHAGQVTLTLSYLAWNFDWQANYVATLQPGGRSADLTGWITLANGDVTGFADAETMVVAGKLEREDRDYETPDYDVDGEISFTCYAEGGEVPPPPPPPPMPVMMPAPAPPMAEMNESEVIVTASRIARQEDLGDLKLYRIPDRTNVSAMSRKQVGLLDRKSVPIAVIHRVRIEDDSEYGVELVLRLRNRKADGLGLPLPAGSVAIFEPLGEAHLLVGEATIGDKAIGEEVDLEFGMSPGVNVVMDDGAGGGNWREHVATVTNDNPWPVRFEAELSVSEGYERSHVSQRLSRKNGRDLWAVEIPANGTRTLRYRLTEVKAR